MRTLTDRGTEYCGKIQAHAYQRFLAVGNIDHSKTKARSPQTNGICERFHRTMKQEFYNIAFRKKVYHTLEELQTDVDEWLKKYNEMRPHSGRYCYGKTPMQTFLDSRSIAREKQLESLCEVSENEMTLFKAKETSLGTHEQKEVFAPSEEVSNSSDFHGAKHNEAKKDLHLTDNKAV